MEIRTLGLVNFGKFANKKINLSSGINIIYGENEKGKSTIHSFIDGIFYGFSKNNLKRRITDDLFESYKPWNFDSYKGYIELVDKDRFRINRDFNTQEVSVFNLDTGLNLTNLPTFRKYSRIEQPGVYFFDLNRDEFNRSIYISQLNSKLDIEGKNLLKEKINNFISTKRDDISYKNAINSLEKYIQTLGKPTWSRSKIGKVTREISTIENELLNLEDDKKKYYSFLEKLSIVEKKLQTLEKNYSGRVLYDLDNLKKEIVELEKLKEKYLKEKINIKDYERVFELNTEIANLLLRNDNLYLESDNNLFINEEIESDFKIFKNIIGEIAELNNVNSSKEMEFLSLDIKKVKIQNLKFKSAIIISFFLIVLVIFISLFFKKYYIMILIPILGFYIYLRIVKFRVNNELLKRLQNKMIEYKEFSIQKTAKKKSYDIDFDKFLKKYNKENRKELEEFFNNKIKENNKIRNQIDFLNFKREDIKEEAKKITNEITEKERELKNLLNKYSVSNVNEFRNKFEEYDENSYILKINEKKDEYNKLLKEKKENISYYNDKSRDILKNEIKQMNLNISNTLGLIKSKENSVIKIKQLEEEKQKLNKKLSNLLFEKEAAKISLDTIKEILTENRDNLIPKVKEFISNNLKKITNAKYSDILIDDSLNIFIYDYEYSKYVDLNCLSVGTIDQIYFLFRLSITSIEDNKLPLILDDCFSNYDDERLKNSLKFLQNFNQIILFTSTKREIEILNKLNINYNLVNL